ncbi:zinc-binding dehydrogenase family protein [Orientia chuto str. Dubai]|uniref:Zinc-binding dehydrogenase family protein n=1 Tax=Orientia chuto str. Dubai TaxID=1359168 RepID=A0A0F3MP79_9RICK|nr:zinc-binding dehydrogenase [Candidatus Orientia mediorientalis]KJV57476.1 zinc-binding dehydrogenase family protein [Orientia chuto str. Dubai]
MNKQKLYRITYGNSKPSFDLVEANIPVPEDNEILIKHTAIGINFQDYEHYKKTLTPISSIPNQTDSGHKVYTNVRQVIKSFLCSSFKNENKANIVNNNIVIDNKFSNIVQITPGIEAVGIVQKIGKFVKDFQVGQRVGYCTVTDGAYSQYRTINSNYVFKIQDSISDEAAATNLVKGMTAHYLMRRTFYVQPNMTILIHAASSAVGQTMLRLAKEYKAITIATIGSDDQEKKSILKNLKCDYILNYNKSDWVKQVKEITNNKGVNVVYDCLGAQTILESVSCLMPFGLMVLFGQITGNVNVINPQLLTQKSLFFTMPQLQYYKQDGIELLLSALEVFALIEKGVLPKKADKIYKFDNILQAMYDIENHRNPGTKVVLL